MNRKLLYLGHEIFISDQGIFYYHKYFYYKAANAVPAFAAQPFGTVTSDITLDPSVTYVVQGTDTVMPNVTLTIPAGTHFIFTPGSQIYVSGNVVAEGTADNHIVIVGGPVPPFIPEALPAARAITTDASSTPETPEVAPLLITSPDDASSTPVTETPATTPPVVSNSVMMSGDTTTDDTNKHYGFLFVSGSSGIFSYTDISDAGYAMKIDPHTIVTVDHSNFNNCTIGILGNGGKLTLTNTNFSNTPQPLWWDFGGTFIHSNNTFSNTDVKGWIYFDGPGAGTTTLDSTDGEYYFPSIYVGVGSTLIIKPGVKVFVKDGGRLEIDGSLSAIGTADNPVIFYGDGICTTHSPTMTFPKSEKVSLEHVQFRDLCGGLQGSQSTVHFSHLDFDTIAGPVIDFSDTSTVNADYITMEDVYQGFKIDNSTRLTTTHDTLDVVNGIDPAISATRESPISISDTTIKDATTCVGISKNSSLSADTLTLSHCSKVGILSDNDSVDMTSGITLTDSEISSSGGAMDLSYAQATNISRDTFHDDGTGVVLAHMPKTVLINNDWGSDTGPTIDSNPGGTGTAITANNVTEVDYRPWIGMQAPPEHNPIIIVPALPAQC